MRLPLPITSRTNAKVKGLRAAFTGKAARPGELTALEGEHLLSEAAAAGLMLETVFVRGGDEALLRLPSLRSLRAHEHVVLSRDVFDAVVETTSPQGIAGTLAIPQPASLDAQQPGPILVLENVQDPGNVGTLIRSAAAFGALQVYLVGESANAWSPKVLRASVGSVFRVTVARAAWPQIVALRTGNRPLLAAVVDGSKLDSLPNQTLRSPILLIGSEGRGLSAEALAAADQRITIPCRIESLNAAVAGSILLYECFRQRAS